MSDFNINGSSFVPPVNLQDMLPDPVLVVDPSNTLAFQQLMGIVPPAQEALPGDPTPHKA